LKLDKRLEIVANILTECKEHLACIVIQIITLFYDDLFVNVYDKFYKTSKITKQTDDDGNCDLDINNQMLEKDIKEDFPFFDDSFYNKVLHVVMNYLSESSMLGNYSINSLKCRKAVEKAFMFVTTIDRDCFLTSVKCLTDSDYIFFDLPLNRNSTLDRKFRKLRCQLIDILDGLSSG